MQKIILASTSPRRKELLESADLNFEVCSVQIDEQYSADEAHKPIAYVERMAHEKAEAVLIKNQEADTVIITADTIAAVAQDDMDHDLSSLLQQEKLQVLVKPVDKDDAVRMWQMLSKKQHYVISSVCVCYNDKRLQRTVLTKVRFTEITESMMDWYWNTGEPQDKAGAYAIQGMAAAWVESIHGSYTNVVGLPLTETLAMIAYVTDED